MSLRLVAGAVLLGLVSLPVPATAQQEYLYGEQNFRNACPPPLKYAAGTCVRRCPAGYRDLGGRYCRTPSRMGW